MEIVIKTLDKEFVQALNLPSDFVGGVTVGVKWEIGSFGPEECRARGGKVVREYRGLSVRTICLTKEGGERDFDKEQRGYWCPLTKEQIPELIRVLQSYD